MATAIESPVERILAIEAASGVALFAATLVALVWANASPASYEALWHAPIGVKLGTWSCERSLEFCVNEGLMTIFFFVVGLEIRREIFEGSLATLRSGALPLLAAFGGMLVPAALFAACNLGHEGAAGWAVPMATDIAFAVGVLTLLGARVPASLRMLLLALAVIDDIGAILVIALFYSDGVALAGVALFGGGIGAVVVMRAAGIRASSLYIVPGFVVWLGFLVAGIHPTIAGVVLGLLTPAKPWFGTERFVETTRAQLEALPEKERSGLLASLDRINHARREAVAPVERLHHVLHPWVAFVVMPVFALANAGVVLGGARWSGDYLWLFLGIVMGLAIGKPLGIVAAAFGATRIGLATSPDDVSGRGIVLVGLVGGIGFTMSLFIAQLAFLPGPLLDTAKLAILVGSCVAVIVGLVFGLVVGPAPTKPQAR